jgi:hypothetical protein
MTENQVNHVYKSTEYSQHGVLVMKYFLVISFIFILGGCTSFVRATFIEGPDGDFFVIDCHEVGLTFCYRKADQVCPRGYNTVAVTDTANPNITVECITEQNS